MRNNECLSETLTEEIIGQTVLHLLAQQKMITLPSLLLALQQHPDVEQIRKAETLLKSAFTIRAA